MTLNEEGSAAWMALRANNYKLDIHVIIGATAKVALIGKCLLALPFLM